MTISDTDNIHEVIVPPQHAEIELYDANETYLFATRGGFKSSVGGGLFNIRRVFEMPRSTGVGVGISFNNLYENTLPPLKAFLINNGFVEDVHFTICKPPPANWPKPYMGIVDKKYTNTMTWYNGTSKQFVSLRRKASANGVSAQWGDFDEVKFMKEKVLVDEIFPIFRGNEKYFKHCSGYLSKFFMTDKNADPAAIKWLLAKRDLVNKEKLSIVLSLSLELRRLKEEYNKATKFRQNQMKVAIHAVETRLAILRSNLVLVAEISAHDVRPILGDKWFKDKERNTSTFDFKTIYLNEDPDRPGKAFYPSWDSAKITYESDDDINPDKPLIITPDYQHSIAPITISQIDNLHSEEKPSLNYVDEVYTLQEEGGLRLAVKKFCKKYGGHRFKHVYYVYDATAISDRQDAETFKDIVIDELENNDWTVWEVYTGAQPGHFQKYVDTMEWMENKNGEHMDIRINRKRCKKLIISITGAAAVTIGKETKKYKKPEIDDSLDQSETTHFSDCFDMNNDAVLKQKLITEIMESIPFSFGRA